MSGKMSTIDRLRAVNNASIQNELDKTTVVKEDVEEIEEFYGINKPEVPVKEEEPVKEPRILAPRTSAVKRTVGRPKTRSDNESYSQVHINLPESLKLRVQQATVCHKTNMNSYIVSLIEKDIRENGSDYQNIYETMSKYSV